MVLAVLAVAGVVGVPGSAIAQACQSGTESDFDGDGQVDLAIADPDATVGSAARSGAVHIAYGDGRRQSISQADIADNDTADGDRFGYSLDSTDWNGDGCADLFVGVPFENWSNNTEAEAGVVVYIPGSPSGLATDQAATWSQASLGADIIEPGDRFGFDLAAGIDTAGEPFLVVGAPGENTITAEGVELDHIGRVVYVRPGGAVDFDQRSPGWPMTSRTATCSATRWPPRPRGSPSVCPVSRPITPPLWRMWVWCICSPTTMPRPSRRRSPRPGRARD
ncbi:hypothetical protein GCM10029992_25360 [Glycomyces albus]